MSVVFGGNSEKLTAKVSQLECFWVFTKGGTESVLEKSVSYMKHDGEVCKLNLGNVYFFLSVLNFLKFSRFFFLFNFSSAPKM